MKTPSSSGRTPRRGVDSPERGPASGPARREQPVRRITPGPVVAVALVCLAAAAVVVLSRREGPGPAPAQPPPPESLGGGDVARLASHLRSRGLGLRLVRTDRG